MADRPPPKSLLHFDPMNADTSVSVVAAVVKHVESMLRTGRVESGARLPSERTVALDIGVSRNSVTAAYDELEQKGLIRRIRGKGAFMCNTRVNREAFSWSGKVSSKAHLLDEPVLDLLARSRSTGVAYPLSAGTPSLECFPVDVYHECINRVVENDFPQALSVAPTEGQWRLREAIGNWLKVDPKHVMVTSGAQEGIDLLARCLIETGEVAIVESPTYPGALQCLRATGAKLVGWETDWSLEKLEQLILRYRPKLILTTPTFQNPTGRVMPLSTRKGLLDLASRYCVPIIEDEVYSKTYFRGRPGPESLFKLDTHSSVITVSTFSKMLAPGLRVGWIMGPTYMIKQLCLMKMRANLFTGGINQLALADFITSGRLDRHLSSMRQHHHTLRGAAAAGAQSAVKAGLLSYVLPNGGLYLWCKLGPWVDMDLLTEIAAEKGLNFAPGHAFFPEEPSIPYLRICYTAATAIKVRRGLELLGKILRQLQLRAGATSSLEAAASTGPPGPV